VVVDAMRLQSGKKDEKPEEVDINNVSVPDKKGPEKALQIIVHGDYYIYNWVYMVYREYNC